MVSPRPEEQLSRIGDLYEEALEAAEAGDLERAQELVAGVDPLVGAIPRIAEPSGEERRQHQRATRAFSALMDHLATERLETRVLVGRYRQGRKMLAAYARRSVESGIRLERDG